MTNDQVPMTNKIPMTQFSNRFGIGILVFIRHWDLDIGY